MPKVSAEHKDAVRRRILDATLVCLERNGYQDVTTRELLAEAGLSTGTFYNYFPSKEDLYATLAEEVLAADIARIVAARSDGTPVGMGLVGFLGEQVLGDPATAVAVSSLRSRMHAGPDAETGADGDAGPASRLNRHVVHSFAPLVREATDDGFLRPDIDPEAVIELVDLVWDGMGRRAAQGTFQTSYGRVARALLQVLLDGVVSPNRRREVPNV